MSTMKTRGATRGPKVEHRRESASTLPAVMFEMPSDHPVVPGVHCNDVAMILAAGLAGAPLPGRLDGTEVLPLLRAGLLACGGTNGMLRRSARDRALNLEMLRSPTASRTTAYADEKRELWGGGARREHALINLAFHLVNTPFTATVSATGPVEVAA